MMVSSLKQAAFLKWKGQPQSFHEKSVKQKYFASAKALAMQFCM